MENLFLKTVQTRTTDPEVQTITAPIVDMLATAGAVILLIAIALIGLGGLIALFTQIYRLVNPDENDIRKQFRMSRLIGALLAIAIAGGGIWIPIWQGVTILQFIF